ncbi:MAG: hypothetical protein WAM62_10370, partial [Pseudolabrys sp.]
MSRRHTEHAAPGMRRGPGRGIEEHGSGASAVPRGFDSATRFSAGRVLLVALVLAGLLWIGWRIIADTAASNLAAADPETAIGFMADNSEALDELAFREFTKSGGDLALAENLAKRALRSDPLDERALAILGLIAERHGDQARADRLLRLSGQRSWRDTATQAWLVNRDIQTGKFEEALTHVDALLRVDWQVMEQTFPVLSAFTIDNRTFNVLANLLAANPPWRPDFLSRLSAQAPDTGRLTQLYAALQNSPHPPDAKELSPYLDRLIRDGKFAQAYQAWKATLSPQNKAISAVPYNGDFAASIDGLPF